MERPGLMGKEEKKGHQVRKENQGRKESEENLVRLERPANHPMMLLSKVLLVHQDLPDLWALLALRDPPGQGTTEPIFSLLILWGCCMQFQMMKLHP